MVDFVVHHLVQHVDGMHTDLAVIVLRKLVPAIAWHASPQLLSKQVVHRHLNLRIKILHLQLKVTLPNFLPESFRIGQLLIVLHCLDHFREVVLKLRRCVLHMSIYYIT